MPTNYQNTNSTSSKNNKVNTRTVTIDDFLPISTKNNSKFIVCQRPSLEKLKQCFYLASVKNEHTGAIIPIDYNYQRFRGLETDLDAINENGMVSSVDNSLSPTVSILANKISSSKAMDIVSPDNNGQKLTNQGKRSKSSSFSMSSPNKRPKSHTNIKISRSRDLSPIKKENLEQESEKATDPDSMRDQSSSTILDNSNEQLVNVSKQSSASVTFRGKKPSRFPTKRLKTTDSESRHSSPMSRGRPPSSKKIKIEANTNTNRVNIKTEKETVSLVSAETSTSGVTGSGKNTNLGLIGALKKEAPSKNQSRRTSGNHSNNKSYPNINKPKRTKASLINAYKMRQKQPQTQLMSAIQIERSISNGNDISYTEMDERLMKDVVGKNSLDVGMAGAGSLGSKFDRWGNCNFKRQIQFQKATE